MVTNLRAGFVAAFYVSSSLRTLHLGQQELDDLRPSSVGRRVQRRVPSRVALVDIGTVSHKQLHHLDMAPSGRHLERRYTLELELVHLGTG